MSDTTVPASETASGWGPRLAIFCLTAAIAVSVIYLPQSLLTKMASDLGVDPALASLAATAVQIGYAVGIFLLVPLADRVHPRRQITIEALLLVVALVVAAFSPGVIALILSFFAVGIVANIAQIILPAASRLSPPRQRGATTSILVGSFVTGIFGGRILASVLADPLGWRVVVLIFAALVLITVPLVRRALRAPFPGLVQRSYGAILLNTLKLVRSSPALLESAAMQFCMFGAFTTLWTVSVLQLTGPAYGWTVLGAGLFGFVGLAAGVLTPFAGRFIDRFGSIPVAGVAIGVTLLAVLSITVVSGLLVPFAIAMFFTTLGNQVSQSSNQLRAIASSPGQAAGANTVFMVLLFGGGSLGAFLGPVAYFAGGMALVGVVASAFLLVALAVWILVFARHRRRVEAP